MRKAGWVATCLGGSLLALVAVFGSEAQKLFRPPRTGVVDISSIFEEYGKKQDREAEMKQETKVIEDKLKELEKRYKEISADINNYADGPKKNERLFEKYKLEIEVKQFKDTELKRLEETQIKYLQEIRAEIEDEINAFAKSQDLELVLEKAVTASREGPRWAIVHFAAPELDISREILTRLNTRYRAR